MDGVDRENILFALFVAYAASVCYEKDIHTEPSVNAGHYSSLHIGTAGNIDYELLSGGGGWIPIAPEI